MLFRSPVSDGNSDISCAPINLGIIRINNIKTLENVFIFSMLNHPYTNAQSRIFGRIIFR